MNISELEQASGVPRSTIYFYVRDGLLPPAHKKAANRGVYSGEHLTILQEITRLKDEGLALPAIRERVAPLADSVSMPESDVVNERAAQVRRAILEAAADLFSRNGYKGTRVSDIIERVGVTPPTLYSLFPSKHDLFVEAFGVFVEWMRESLDSTLPENRDAVLRELPRLHTYYLGIKTVGADLLALVRSEAVNAEGDLRDVAREAFKCIVRDILDDLVDLRRQSGTAVPMVDELTAFGLFGALDSIVMRACWDDTYSPLDVLRTACGLLVGVQAVYRNSLDVCQVVAEYSDLVERLAKGSLQLPERTVSWSQPVAGV